MAKSKKKPKWNWNSNIRGALRRMFARSPVVREVMQEGRRESPRYNKDGSVSKRNKVEYQCQVCGGWFPSKFMSVDHIEPVISPEHGFEDWNTFIERLCCDKSNLQRICSYTKKHEDSTSEFGRYSCHYLKTQREARILRELKKKV